MWEDHCDSRLGTRTQVRQEGAREKLYSSGKGPICFQGQTMEKEGGGRGRQGGAWMDNRWSTPRREQGEGRGWWEREGPALLLAWWHGPVGGWRCFWPFSQHEKEVCRVSRWSLLMKSYEAGVTGNIWITNKYLRWIMSEWIRTWIQLHYPLKQVFQQ